MATPPVEILRCGGRRRRRDEDETTRLEARGRDAKRALPGKWRGGVVVLVVVVAVDSTVVRKRSAVVAVAVTKVVWAGQKTRERTFGNPVL